MTTNSVGLVGFMVGCGFRLHKQDGRQVIQDLLVEVSVKEK